jgi:ABC-type antimicrobial peptide transport system permease subunit
MGCGTPIVATDVGGVSDMVPAETYGYVIPFDDRDALRGQPVAVVNDTMARFYFGGQSALGKVILNGSDRYTIVGVVKDSRQRDLTAETAGRRFYLPLLQTSDDISSVTFIVQTRGDATVTLPAVRRESREWGALTVTMVEAVRTLMTQSLSGERSVATLSGVFALVALLLAAAGLYGVIAYATARRTGEIGLRMALGASRMSVTRMVLREALALTLAGLAIGLPGGWVILKVFAAGVVGAGDADPLPFVMTIAAMLMVAAAAAGVPALRAARVDPAIALRRD